MELKKVQSWSDRYSLLSPWFMDIMTVVKKDCKQEHLRLDPQFVRQHFNGQPVHKIRVEDMRAVYLQQVLAGNERLAEFISNRWVFRNMELYRFFETELQEISPDFEEIKELSDEQATGLIELALKQFGVEKVFCFVLFNEVALPDKIFNQLQRDALEVLANRQQVEESSKEEDVNKKHLQELERVKSKYEKKLVEMAKKYQSELNQLRVENERLKIQSQATQQAL